MAVKIPGVPIPPSAFYEGEFKTLADAKRYLDATTKLYAKLEQADAEWDKRYNAAIAAQRKANTAWHNARDKGNAKQTAAADAAIKQAEKEMRQAYEIFGYARKMRLKLRDYLGWAKAQVANWGSERMSASSDSGFKPPEGAKNNAQKVLDWKEDYGDEVKGMTSVGWDRARQLASGKDISLETVSKMAQFNRHRKNSEVAAEHKSTPWKDAGYVAWLGWGGTTGIEWAIKTMDSQKGKSMNKQELSERITMARTAAERAVLVREMQQSEEFAGGMLSPEYRSRRMAERKAANKKLAAEVKNDPQWLAAYKAHKEGVSLLIDLNNAIERKFNEISKVQDAIDRQLEKERKEKFKTLEAWQKQLLEVQSKRREMGWKISDNLSHAYGGKGAKPLNWEEFVDATSDPKDVVDGIQKVRAHAQSAMRLIGLMRAFME